MADVKKILLLTSASNFETQKQVIRSVDKKLKEIGGFALYVFSSYGLYREENAYDDGEKSIYSLLEESSFDGCILSGNIANRAMYRQFIDILRRKNIPFLTTNFGLEDSPFLLLDSYDVGCQLMEHLIMVHHCTKINLIALDDKDVITNQLVKAYRDTLAKYSIPADPKRMISMTVSIQHGKDAFHIFRERGIEDAEAVICMHDVYAIGLCLEMEAQGYHVPEDLIICSLNRSTNSVVFRPDITGADRMESELTEKATEMLIDMINGKEIPRENYFKGKIYYGQSCGCNNANEEQFAKRFQDIILAKVESGNQISSMMQYNDSLEEVVSFDEMGQSIKRMLQGINCNEFIFCLNPRTIKYITNETKYIAPKDGKAFEQNMVAVTGYTERTGEIKDLEFSIEKLLPIEAKEGDLLLFLPIHHKERVHGYVVFVNEYLPIDVYNYRICHESIGISMENLHRQMLLRKSIEELDVLHMQDALTGLHNVFGWNRFQQKYIDTQNYCVVVIDMDGLKKINDGFGHLAGNNALCIVANAINEVAGESDLVARCGGDEFQILSLNTDADHWEQVRENLNEKIRAQVKLQKLPYDLGASLGYCICREEEHISFKVCCETADRAMYENKRARKQCRVD